MAANIQPRIVLCQQLNVVSLPATMLDMVAHTKSEQFAQRLNKLLDENGAPHKNLGRARWFHNLLKNKMKIDVSYEAARKWLTGESIPYTKRIGVIARGLNSTTEYLIGETTNHQPFMHQEGVFESSAPYIMEDKELLDKIHQLSKDDRARLNNIVDALNSTLDHKAANKK
jgi:hypothetical protein